MPRAQTLSRFVFFSLTALAALAPAPAIASGSAPAAAPAPTPGLALVAGAEPAADQIAILTVRVNEDERGEIPVVLRGNDVLVPASHLKELWLEGAASRGRREISGGQEYVSLLSLAPAITFSTDEQGLTLSLHAAPSLLPATQINLLPTAPAGIDYDSHPSFFFNYAPRLIDLKQLDASGEAGLSAGKALFWSAASYSTTHGLLRGLSNITLDDRSSMRRLVLGDAFSSAGALGGGVYAGGVSISRNFDLDPYFVRGPTLGASTFALTPSQLSVYVNGVLVRQQQVAPGPVQIHNLQAQSGAGVAQYVLRDVFGREQSLASPFYLSNGVLKAGVEEYTYTVGIRRDHLGLTSFDYSEPVALARHRVGLNNRTTLGGRFEMGSGSVSAGSTLTWLADYGLLDLAVGASQAGGAGGLAAAASYSFQSPGAGVGFLVQAMSPRYSTVSLSPEDDRPGLQINAFASLSLGRRASLGAQHTIALHRDAGLLGQATVLGGYQIDQGISLQATLGRAALPQGKIATDGMVTVSFNIDRTSAQLSAHARSEGSNEAIATVARPLPRAIGAGYRATATYSDGDLSRALASAEYQGAHGAYGASYETEKRSVDGARAHHLTLSTRGGLVWLPGVGVFASRPVGQAVAVLRLPGVAGVRGYLNNQEIGRTDRDGNLLIPDLLPYYANRIRLADDDLPLSYLIEGTEKLVAPPFRGASVARFSARRVLFFRGSIVVLDRRGAPTLPAYGELRVKAPGKLVESPVGKAGEIEIDGLAPGSYPAEIVHESGACHFRIVLPDAPGPFVDLGELKCIRP